MGRGKSEEMSASQGTDWKKGDPGWKEGKNDPKKSTYAPKVKPTNTPAEENLHEKLGIHLKWSGK